MHNDATAPADTGFSSYRQHLYVFILMVLVMTVANTLWPASRVKDYRPTELPPALRSCDVYPAPQTVTP